MEGYTISQCNPEVVHLTECPVTIFGDETH